MKHGGRPNVKKVIILLTDGAQNPDKKDFDPVAKSQKLFDDGVKIFAVSVLYFLWFGKKAKVTNSFDRARIFKQKRMTRSEKFIF